MLRNSVGYLKFSVSETGRQSPQNTVSFFCFFCCLLLFLLPIGEIMFNTNDVHIVRNCQMYFNFDMPSTLWAKRVRTFNVKFSASNNMFRKATLNALRTSRDFAMLS